MKCLKNWLIGILLVALSSGCATQKSWVYRPSRYSQPLTVSTNTIVVLPFEDHRSDVNKNKIALYLIPLFPLGWANMDAPEGVSMHVTTGMWMNYKPTEDFTSALVSEFKSASFMKEAYRGNRKTDADYYVQGRILNTKYKGKIFSYGLSAYGPILWIFGLPAGSFSNELSVELNCFNSKTGQPVLSKTYTAEPYGKVFWMYNMGNDFNYADLLQSAYKQFVTDLSKKIK